MAAFTDKLAAAAEATSDCNPDCEPQRLYREYNEGATDMVELQQRCVRLQEVAEAKGFDITCGLVVSVLIEDAMNKRPGGVA